MEESFPAPSNGNTGTGTATHRGPEKLAERMTAEQARIGGSRFYSLLSSYCTIGTAFTSQLSNRRGLVRWQASTRSKKGRESRRVTLSESLRATRMVGLHRPCSACQEGRCSTGHQIPDDGAGAIDFALRVFLKSLVLMKESPTRLTRFTFTPPSS